MRISDWSSDVCSSDLLWQRCGLTVWYNDPARDIALWQRSPNAEIFLAESAGSVAGSICCGHDGHRGWLYAAAVDPDRQHRGIGTRLGRPAADWRDRQGYLKIARSEEHPSELPHTTRNSNAQLSSY